jgi:hypothetical protein
MSLSDSNRLTQFKNKMESAGNLQETYWRFTAAGNERDQSLNKVSEQDIRVVVSEKDESQYR